jgi:hypothetical protein
MGVRHLTFAPVVVFHDDGSTSSAPTPEALGPRKDGQLDALTVEETTQQSRESAALFMDASVAGVRLARVGDVTGRCRGMAGRCRGMANGKWARTFS